MPIKILIKEHDFGDTVYLRTDSEQLPWEIDHVTATPLGIIYGLFRNGDMIDAYEHQFTKDRDMLKVVGAEGEE